MTNSARVLAVGLLSSVALGCQEKKEPAVKAAPVALAKESSPTGPGVVSPGMLGGFKPSLSAAAVGGGATANQDLVQLGKALFFDERLSKNHDIACVTCHDLSKFGVDGLAASVGHKRQSGTRNAPTVYNAAGHFAQFWDGRSKDVEEQATMHVLNPVEMAMPDEQRVTATLSSIPEYQAAFAQVFPGEESPVSLKNAGRALGAYERQLVLRAPWDDFLEGQADALTQPQKDGFLAFLNAGCSSCHNGTYLGGNSFQKLGAMRPWPNQKDKGKFEVSKNVTDEMMFKVPSLRNVAETGPYFHDGSVTKLEEAVSLMAQHQLGRELPPADVAAIVVFLGALTGELPTKLIEPPALPKSTKKTPKPDPT